MFKKGQKVVLELHGYGKLYWEDAVIDTIKNDEVTLKPLKGINAGGPGVGSSLWQINNIPLGPYRESDGWFKTWILGTKWRIV